jgi:dienelactone hydrolase
LKTLVFTSLLLMASLWACADSGTSSPSDPGDWQVVAPDGEEPLEDTGSGPEDSGDTAPEADVAYDVPVAPPGDTTEADIADVLVTDIPGVAVVPPSGPGDFEVTLHEVNVNGSGASFEAELYVPGGMGLRPAILLLPGFTLAAGDFSKTSERLASHGFIVLCPSFDDGVFSPIDHADLANHTSSFFDWLIAQHQTSDSPVFARLDTGHFGTAGHSRGGKVALLAASQDSRIKATYGLDPVDTVGGPFSGGPTPANPSVTPELMDELAIPLGFFGAGKGGEGLQPCAPEAENHAAYYEAASAAPVAYHHVDMDAGHMDFTDSGAAGFCAAGEDPSASRAAATSTLVAFFRVHLGDDATALSWLTGEHVDPRLTWETK